jgi:hypothetical protein
VAVDDFSLFFIFSLKHLPTAVLAPLSVHFFLFIRLVLGRSVLERL